MSTKPTVTTDLRNNYLLALNALVGQLNPTEFTPLDPIAFTGKYQISENALLVLGNMGFLNVQVGSPIPAFKRTSGLLNVKPDHLIKWVARYNSENGVVESINPVEQVQAPVSESEPIKVVDLPKDCNFAGSDCPNSICGICKDAASKSSIAEDIKNTLDKVHVPPISQRRKEIDLRMPISEEVKQLQESVRSLNSLTPEHPVVKELQQLREEVDSNLSSEPQQLSLPSMSVFRAKGFR